jgi:hypothetical protein
MNATLHYLNKANGNTENVNFDGADKEKIEAQANWYIKNNNEHGEEFELIEIVYHHGCDLINRNDIVKKANELITKAETPEARTVIKDIVSDLLMAAHTYKGFSFIAWRDGGFSQWNKDGRPEDNSKYLGDKTKIYFY